VGLILLAINVLQDLKAFLVLWSNIESHRVRGGTERLVLRNANSVPKNLLTWHGSDAALKTAE